MRIGDVVRVRATRRQGQIVEDVRGGRRRVEFYPVDDRVRIGGASAASDEVDGIFSDAELEPIQTAHATD